jgi:hypothetical protein
VVTKFCLHSLALDGYWYHMGVCVDLHLEEIALMGRHQDGCLRLCQLTLCR